MLMLSGSIMGVGMFAIPYSFYKVGFWIGAFELCVLAGVVLSIHLAYGEIVLRSAERHRLPGYARMYLGGRAALVASVSGFWGIAGTLLVYIILGGVFLDNLLKNLVTASSPVGWSLLFAGTGLITTFFPLRRKAILTSVMTTLLITFMCVLILFVLPYVRVNALSGFYPSRAIMPYGIVFFALTGATIIPDVVTYMRGNRACSRRVIIGGSLVPAALYFLFALAVTGASGSGVSIDAISGLTAVAGNRVVTLGNIIGLIAVSTAYVLLNSSFQAFLSLDLSVSRRLAWVGASFIPFGLFVLGFQNFIPVISAVGATAIAIDGGLIIAIYHLIMHRHERVMTRWDIIRFGFIYAMLVAGAAYQLYEFLTAWG